MKNCGVTGKSTRKVNTQFLQGFFASRSLRTLQFNACHARRLLGLTALALFPLLILPSSSSAATVSAWQDGNWSSRSTWIGTAKTGTIASSTASAVITGTGTAFLSELTVGDKIVVVSSTSYKSLGTISSITSNTSLTLSTNATLAVSGVVYYSNTSPPGSSDDVVIAKINMIVPVTVTVDSNVTCSSLTLSKGDSGATYGSFTVTVPTGVTLTVSGTTELLGPNATLVSNYLNVSGTLITPYMRLGGGGSGTRICALAIADGGVATVSGDIDLAASPDAQLTALGNGQLNLGGNMRAINSPTGFAIDHTISFASTSIFNFNGTVQQAIVPTATTVYGTVYFNNSSVNGATLFANITAANVIGDIKVQSGIFTNQGSGSMTTLRPASSNYTITGNSGKTFEVDNGATLKEAGTYSFPTGFGTITLQSTSTVDYIGTTQTISPQNYGNLNVSAGASAGRAVTLSSTGTIAVFTNFTPSSTNNVYTLTGSTVAFTGNLTQTLPSSFATYTNLVINNAAGASLAANVTVNGTLTLTSGVMSTGANTLICPSGSSVSRTGGHVFGNFQKNIATGATSKTFEVGDATNYAPVNISFASVTTAGNLKASNSSGDHANIGTSTINASKSVNRNWTLTNSGILFTNYSVTFTFVAGDIDAGASTSAFIVGKYSGGSWTYPTVGTKTATTTQATGLTSFSDFQIGEYGYSISGNVFEDKNYGGGAGRSLASSSGIARGSARVELFDSGGTYQTFATTDGSGNYAFSAMLAATYTVRVVNSSVTSSRGGAGLLSVQTFRTNGGSGAAVAVTDHVGGETPGLADAGNGSTTLASLTTATTTAQSITTVTIGSSDVIGVDFGYSFNVIVNKNDTGQGSLRQFLLNANALSNTGLAQSGLTAGIDNAVFMLADGTARSGLTASYASQFTSGVATVALASPLPTISDPAVLDGTLQPGYTSAPMIELNGVAGGASASGLTITAGASTVRGLVINRFTGYGINLSTTGNNTIAGNYIGINAAGTAALANAVGVQLTAGGNNNIIGGTTTAARNVISGNTGDGIVIDGSATTGNLVQGNYIGINAAGNGAISNGGNGVDIINSASNNTIGGSGAGAGNVISGNSGKGIVIVSGTGNAILSNSIYGNAGIGIDLTNDGVTVNDGTKSGALANYGMDTPVFTTAQLSGTTLTLAGYVGSAAGQAVFASATVQIFKSDIDGSGYGEGQTYLGTLTADGSGNFSGTLTVGGLVTSDRITGTAIDGTNNTSEFGLNATVNPPQVLLVQSVTPSGSAPPGTDLVFTFAFTNSGGLPASVYIITDPMPTYTDFKVASAIGNLGTTGLTVTVEYSSDNASTWTYTPVSGGGGAPANYDRSVTHVRWRFTGNLSQTSPNNTGSVSLTARIR